MGVARTHVTIPAGDELIELIATPLLLLMATILCFVEFNPYGCTLILTDDMEEDDRLQVNESEFTTLLVNGSTINKFGGEE